MTADRPPIPVDYASPPPGKRRGAITSIPLTASLCLAYATVAVIAFLAVPPMETLFRDFKTELPTITKVFLATTRWFSTQFGWLATLPLPFVIPIITTRLTSPAVNRQQRKMRMQLLVMFNLLLLAGIVLTAALALFLPLVSLIEAATKP